MHQRVNCSALRVLIPLRVSKPEATFLWYTNTTIQLYFKLARCLCIVIVLSKRNPRCYRTHSSNDQDTSKPNSNPSPPKGTPPFRARTAVSDSADNFHLSYLDYSYTAARASPRAFQQEFGENAVRAICRRESIPGKSPQAQRTTRFLAECYLGRKNP